MMVHRLLDKYLNGGRAVNREKLETECKHSSDMEQLAANAERASIKYKQVEFMKDRLGQIYEALGVGRDGMGNLRGTRREQMRGHGAYPRPRRRLLRV